MKMPKKKELTEEEVENEVEGFYKGYEIEWLRKEPTHADFYLVAEYDELNPTEEVEEVENEVEVEGGE